MSEWWEEGGFIISQHTMPRCDQTSAIKFCNFYYICIYIIHLCTVMIDYHPTMHLLINLLSHGAVWKRRGNHVKGTTRSDTEPNASGKKMKDHMHAHACTHVCSKI